MSEGAPFCESALREIDSVAVRHLDEATWSISAAAMATYEFDAPALWGWPRPDVRDRIALVGLAADRIAAAAHSPRGPAFTALAVSAHKRELGVDYGGLDEPGAMEIRLRERGEVGWDVPQAELEEIARVELARLGILMVDDARING